MDTYCVVLNSNSACYLWIQTMTDHRTHTHAFIYLIGVTKKKWGPICILKYILYLYLKEKDFTLILKEKIQNIFLFICYYYYWLWWTCYNNNNNNVFLLFLLFSVFLESVNDIKYYLFIICFQSLSLSLYIYIYI